MAGTCSRATSQGKDYLHKLDFVSGSMKYVFADDRAHDDHGVSRKAVSLRHVP